jgi:hypothetical protein
MLAATQNASDPRRGDSKIYRGRGAVENPAPHRMAVLECFRSTPVVGNKKSTPQTHRPTDFLQTDSNEAAPRPNEAAPSRNEATPFGWLHLAGSI